LVVDELEGGKTFGSHIKESFWVKVGAATATFLMRFDAVPEAFSCKFKALH
jgi:hypothetical protein